VVAEDRGDLDVEPGSREAAGDAQPS
jgi:hypothetical protein